MLASSPHLEDTAVTDVEFVIFFRMLFFLDVYLVCEKAPLSFLL